MPILQVGGLASGLDTHQIIDQLISAAQRPRTRLESKVTKLQSQKMSIQTVDASLLALQTRVSLLSNGDSLLSSKATSGDTSSVSATISSSVDPEDVALGAYEIEVIQLAKPYKIANDIANVQNISKTVDQSVSLNQAGFNIIPTSGMFSINGEVITIDDDDVLYDSTGNNGVINKINASAAGVTADYDVNTDKITIKNSTVGDKSVITLGATSDTSNFLSAAGLLNAVQTLDGSDTNTVKSSNRVGLVDINSPLAEAHTDYQGTTSGNFDINNVEITIDHTTESLQDIIDKINSSQAGVSASYNTLTDQFELTSNIGSAQINLANGTSNFLEAVKLLDSNGDTIGAETAGQTAQFKVNGTSVERNSNTNISGVISGVTLNLLAETPAQEPVQLTVERNVDSAVSAIRNFINQYNSTQSILRTAVQNGDLRSDTSISRISQRLFRMMIQPIDGLSTNFNRLSDIGIGRAKANTVTVDSVKSGLEFSILDESKLRNAIAENPTAVADMFRTTEQTAGFAAGMENLLKTYTETNTGIIDGRLEIYDQRIENVQNRLDKFDAKMAQLRTRYVREYAKLESVLATLKSQSSYVSQQLYSLQNSLLSSFNRGLY